MTKRWVLDTDTKGTGAEMVPLEKARGADPGPRGTIVVRDPRPAPEREPAARKPPRFKVVDVMTRQVLAEDVATRQAVEVLAGMRSVVDVNVYRWDDATESWQQLSQGDRRKLWALRSRISPKA
jgi:hypothetical protein